MKISQIIANIDQNYLFVPAFQREYVWKKPDAKRLIDSLIKDYPTGTMLTWKTHKPPELKGNYVHNPTHGAVKLILDGQQRITTLYMLMTGEIPPYYQKKEILHDVRGLYVHVANGSLEYYRKKFMENNPYWVNLTDIFKGDIGTFDIVNRIEECNIGVRLSKSEVNQINDTVNAITDIRNREFLEQTIPIKATIREAIDIFYIVNSSGVNLTEAELALAQISGYWPKAREEFKAKLDQLSENGWVFKLDFIVYALLATMYGMGSNMRKLHGEENKDRIKETWAILDSKVLDYTVNILQSKAYVDHSSEINSVYALIPIIAYIFQQRGYKLNGKQIAKVIKWFYYSQVKNRYISQLPQKLDKDLQVVKSSESPFDELLKLIEDEKGLEIKPYEFVGRSIRSPYFSLMKWVFKSQNAICLDTGLTIRKNMGKKYTLENDHIFAYSVLRDSEVLMMEDKIDYSLAHEFTGRMILTQTGNRTKSNKLADVYLTKAEKRFPGSLQLQCIPEDKELWKVENYKKFLQVRRNLLAKTFTEFLNSISATAPNIVATIDVTELIESAEGQFLEFKATLRYSLTENKVDPRLEDVILKTVAAFSNQEGGTLIIGVTDDKQIMGLENDYNTLREGTRDFFELHLRNILNSAYGINYVSTNIDMSFPKIGAEEICLIKIKPSSQPLFTEIRNKQGNKIKKFFVRSGNSSPELNVQEAADFIKNRF